MGDSWLRWEEFREQWYLWPNLLTLARVVLAALFAVLWGSRQYIPAVVLLATAIASDFVDGQLARRIGTADLMVGRWLDPLCDKAAMFIVFFTLWFGPYGWLIAIRISIEVILMCLTVLGSQVLAHYRLVWGKSLAGEGRFMGHLGANYLGKLKTVFDWCVTGALVLNTFMAVPGWLISPGLAIGGATILAFGSLAWHLRDFTMLINGLLDEAHSHLAALQGRQAPSALSSESCPSEKPKPRRV